MERKGGMRMPWSWLWDPGGEINEGVGIWIWVGVVPATKEVDLLGCF